MSQNVRHLRITARLCLACLLLPATAGIALSAPADAAARGRREAELIKTLTSDASQARKDLACRELQVIGARACIDALEAMLPDEKLSHMARYALESMAYAEAGKALRDALGKTSGTTKVGVITSLGFRRDSQATAELSPLVSDRDQDVAVAAVAALGRIGTPAAAGVLARVRKSATGRLRAVAAEASLTAAEQLTGRGRQAEATVIWEGLQDAKWPAHVRQGAFVGLLSAGGDRAADRAIAAIGGGDPGLRAVAIANSSVLKGPGVGKRLADQLDKLPPDAQVLLIDVLAQRGDPAARPEIVRAAASDSDRVRTAALGALGGIGNATCVALLCKAVATGKNDAERQAAINSLQSLPGEKVNANLLACMIAAPAEARPALIDALAVRQAPGTVNALVEQASGSDATVRTAAFKALGQLATPGDLPALVRLLVSPIGGDAPGEAKRAVVLVSRKIRDDSAQADVVLAALGEAPATSIRCSLLQTLGGIGNAKAFAAITAARSDKDADVQDAAIRALTAWPDARAMDATIGIFRTTENVVHRVLALRGCVRMVGISVLSTNAKLDILGELLREAKRAPDKQLVLSSLADVADPAAIALAKPYLSETTVRGEAELTVLAIAQAIKTSHPAQANAAAQALLKQSKDRMIRRDAGRLVRDLTPSQPR